MQVLKWGLSVLITTLFFTSVVKAQDNDPVLFTVNQHPVHLSEFVYIYSKTNGDKADFSRQSLEEYLDLYTKFKLKVEKAKEMKLDTIPQLQTELAGYRKQLADSYLIDKQVTDRLLKEAYERAQQDVNISHILISSKGESETAKKKALEAKKKIEDGASFESIAQSYSADKSVSKNKGNIGFVTVTFPNGFYPLETAAYTQEIGKLSDPILTSAGYHILKVNDRRPARGEIEVAHILLRKKDKNPVAVKAMIDSIHTLLQGGANFEELARSLSEDKPTAAKGGYIGFFGINRYQKEFEDAAFAIANDNDISAPVETAVGWHILKRLSKKGIQPFNIEKSRLETKIKKDTRYEEAKLTMIKKIKKDNNLVEKKAVLEKFIASQTDTLLTFKWKAPAKKSTEVLFTLNDNQKFTLGDFTTYLGKSTRQRIQLSRKGTLQQAVHSLYEDFVNETCLKLEESMLEKKYPAFKSLMREYNEGILLFEATKMLVWDKASQDSTGLDQFFSTIKGKYRWEERAVVSKFRVNPANKNRVEEIRSYAAKYSAVEVLQHFNTAGNTIVTVEERTYEKSRYNELKNVAWEVGAVSAADENKKNKSITFLKIKELLPAGEKTLKEARGYIVADYQDKLEKKWVDELAKQYNVKIDKQVFESIIQK